MFGTVEHGSDERSAARTCASTDCSRAGADTRRFWRFGGGYSLQQSTRTQTVGYTLVGSPVAQLTRILDKFHS